MATGVLYLDVDDEITTAAARIRAAEGRRVGLVLPYGSRVATSRINFRLLARDALTHEKRLSLISADAATRALAASAGLPVFSSVNEYEASEEAPRPATEAVPIETPTAAPPAEPGRRRRSGARAAAIAATTAGAAAAAEAAAAGAGVPPTGPGEPGPETAGLAASETVVPPAPRPAEPGVDTGATTVERSTAAAGASASYAASVAPRDLGSRPRVEPVPRTGGRGGARSRTPLLVGLAVLALAVVVGGVAAYLLLPSASAVVKPREETIGPVAFQVTASTSVSEPDVEAGVVPAEEISVPVEAADTFTATGKRTEEEKARGAVRFSNLDFTSSNTIAKGAIVSTGSGVRFRTDRAITVPAATLVGLTVVPARASVKVTAVDAGPEGNVEPNTITTIPRGEEPLFLKVTNPDATTGGTREEFPRVTQEDVDSATAALGEGLQTAFTDRLDDPDLSGGDATVFPETAALGETTYSVDPATLVGQEVETFDLGASATGTVTAVDAGPVGDIAEERLLSSVDEGHQLVEGSPDIQVDPAVVTGDTISFPVTVTARQVAILDPAAIEAEIMGKPLADAQAILETYGTAQLEVWPDWVGTIPTFDSRVEVTIDGPVTIETPGSPTALPSEGAP